MLMSLAGDKNTVIPGTSPRDTAVKYINHMILLNNNYLARTSLSNQTGCIDCIQRVHSNAI